ncbi:MAG: hypothetical protein FWG36_01735 [Oscillospiraceae bacterium]|nr:hypothetical protein [Oscillospiraceae bacterium]
MKKRKLTTLILSVIPGCGLMYIGYMKKGLQMMLMFALTLYLTGVTFDKIDTTWGYAFFLLLLPVLWLFQVFETMNSLMYLRRNELEVPDNDEYYLPKDLDMPSLNNNLGKILSFVFLAAGLFGVVFVAVDIANDVLLGGIDSDELITEVIGLLRDYFILAFFSVVSAFLGLKLAKGSKGEKPVKEKKEKKVKEK